MRRTAFLILALFLVSLTLFIVDRVAGLGWIKGAWVWATSPLQRGLSDEGSKLHRSWERWQESGRLQEENEQLREMVDYLTTENRGYQELKRENEELRQLLGLRERYPDLNYLYAEVIGRDPGSLRQIVRVGWSPLKDRKVEVRIGMPVICPAGLVGRVIQVYPNAADVLLITDVSSSVSAMIQNADRPSGVADGRWQAGSRLRMRFIPQEATIQEGDWVLTSGLQLPPFEEESFPPGLPIGRVIRVEAAADMYQEAELLPAADLDHLERVMIVLGAR